MVHAIIDERQSGKTTLAIDLFLKDQVNTILVVMNTDVKKNIITEIGDSLQPENLKNIKPYHKNILIGNKINNLVIDEFFYKKDFQLFFKTAKLVANNLYLIGSMKNKIKDMAFLKTFKGITISNVESFREKFYFINEKMEKFNKFYEDNLNEY